LTQSLASTIQPKASNIIAGTNTPSDTPTVERAVPAAVLAGETVPYEIVAAGDPMVGSGQNPVAVAWRSGTETPDGLASFPDDAQVALEPLRTQGGSDLYLAIYGGLQASGGYEVKIISVDKLNGRLQVTYQIVGPPPGQGAAAVMTHPYVIARIADTTIQPADVFFVEQKAAR
jgi:hypothetical protein